MNIVPTVHTYGMLLNYCLYLLIFFLSFQPRTSFGGFPSGGSSGPGLRRFPGGECGGEESSSHLGSLPNRSADRWGGSQLRPRAHQQDDDSCSDHSSNSSGGGGDHRPDSIPIKVVHQQQRPRYTGTGRNTTELPTVRPANESPRLERAHSEPPNKFTQRLNLGRPAASYTTIPENGEGGGGGSSSAVRGGPNVPTSAGKIPIKPSASAPSVPGSGGSDSQRQPVPPPRRSPPRHHNTNNNTMNNNSSSNTAVPLASGSNVRHIPIFVEGRPEPIFNTASSSSSGATPASGPPPPEMSFPKPSDYYPPGVQRIRSRDSDCGTPDFQFQPFSDAPSFRTHTPTGFRSSGPPSTVITPQQQASAVEPTTPMGPPPGPIPMGYVPTPGVPKEVIQEPTTPLGPPPGPIPMGYMPSAVVTEPLSPVAPTLGPIPMPCDPSFVTPPHQQQQQQQQQKFPTAQPEATAAGGGDSSSTAAPPPPPPPPSSSSSAASKGRRSTVSPVAVAPPAEVAAEEVASAASDEPDRGQAAAPPVVNFIPIRVEHGGPSSTKSSDGARSGSVTRGGQQPPEGPPTDAVGSGVRTMPRSPAPPRKTTGQEGGGENMALLNKLDTIRQEVEKIGERIQNFKVK